MNTDIGKLQDYPFRKLAKLLQGVTPPGDRTPVALSIGEPRHAPPEFAAAAVNDALADLGRYPVTRGSQTLREAAASWANRRYRLEGMPLDPERHVLPCCGSREALFSIAQVAIDRSATPTPVVVMPNPFYQIYEGAALLAGAEPYYANTLVDNGYLPRLDEIPESIWRRTQLLYLCSPGNPTGAVLTHAELVRAIELAQRYDFVIASDECYSEIYFDEAEPPLGLLTVAAELGISDYRGCLVFQSLSKRSNLPGLRSGFVAGDGQLMQEYLRYRTYHGCTMPSLTEAVSIAAWSDEEHVRRNRARYREKFDAVLAILEPALDVQRPDAGFYLWPRVPRSGEEYARSLFATENVTVLPGSYLSRLAANVDPGYDRVRMALVADEADCIDAAQRMRRHLETL